jgi:adenylylsulfate kinase-like enzyme
MDVVRRELTTNALSRSIIFTGLSGEGKETQAARREIYD